MTWSSILTGQEKELDNWISLFNGEDLTHWSIKCQAADRDKNAWFVEDGVIIGQTLNQEHEKIWLYSDSIYDNFRLRLKYQVEAGSDCNSGVVLRGSWDPAGGNGGGFLNGPQVDISARGKDGAIYDETEGSRAWLKEGQTAAYTYWAPQWNEMEIQFKDLQLTVWINGHQVTDYDGSGWFDDENHQAKGVASVAGHIGLQIHHIDRMTIKYKDIMILPL